MYRITYFFRRAVFFNIKVLRNELAQKNEIIKSLMEIQSKVFDSLSVGRNDQTISDQQQQQHHHQQQLQQQQQQQQQA